MSFNVSKTLGGDAFKAMKATFGQPGELTGAKGSTTSMAPIAKQIADLNADATTLDRNAGIYDQRASAAGGLAFRAAVVLTAALVFVLVTHSDLLPNGVPPVEEIAVPEGGGLVELQEVAKALKEAGTGELVPLVPVEEVTEGGFMDSVYSAVQSFQSSTAKYNTAGARNASISFAVVAGASFLGFGIIGAHAKASAAISRSDAKDKRTEAGILQDAQSEARTSMQPEIEAALQRAHEAGRQEGQQQGFDRGVNYEATEGDRQDAIQGVYEGLASFYGPKRKTVETWEYKGN